MDSSKILICNLSKGVIGEDASAVLGAMILTAIQSAALSRSAYEPHQRIPFYLYVDEMHSFVTLSFADMLAEARKYGLALFLTHQYIEQLDERIRSAVFGNVGTMISFRIGATDAEHLEKEFYPAFKADDLVALPRYSMYLKLMIDGTASKPFSAKTVPIEAHARSFRSAILQMSQSKYGKAREQVEKEMHKESPGKRDQQATLFTK